MEAPGAVAVFQVRYRMVKVASEVGMTKENAQLDEREARMGRRVTGKVSVLLTEIEKEEVPDRLLELARKLQTALNEKLER